MVENRAAFGVPVILFSGGEPLLLKDIVQPIKHAACHVTGTALKAADDANASVLMMHLHLSFP